MIPGIAHSPSSQTGRTSNDALGYDFALLGLQAREARVEKIRQAAGATAERIQAISQEDAAELDSMLSEVATSTYRLLDPRRRRKQLERIQLCLFSEADLELQKQSRTFFRRHAG